VKPLEPVAERAPQRTHFEQLSTLGKCFAGASSVNDLLNVMSTIGRELLRVQSVRITTLDAARENLEVRIDGMNLPTHESSAPIPLGSQRPSAECVRTERPFFLGSRQEFAQLFPGRIEHIQGQSWAFLPLEGRGGVFGCLALAYDRARPFEAEERLFLESVARLYALAHERNHLLDTELVARRVVEDGERWAKFFSHVIGLLFGAKDPRAALPKVAQAAVPQLADGCVIDLLAGDRIELAGLANQDPLRSKEAEEVRRRTPPVLGAPGPGRVIATTEPLFRPRATSEMLEARAPDEDHLTLHAADVASVLIVPILADGKGIGAITMTRSPRAGAFAEADVERAKEFAGLVAAALDAARQADAARSSRDLLDSVLRTMEDGITVQDASGRIVFANDAAARLSALPDAETLLRTPPQEVLNAFTIKDEQGRDFPLADLPGRRALRGERPPTVPLRFVNLKTGQERWALVGANPIRDADGKPAFAVNVFRDITHLKGAQEEIKRVNADLEGRFHRRTEDLRAAIQELEAFNYSVSHDLRTPLRGIRGFATLLSEEQGARLDGRGRVYLGYILEATAQMNQIIESLLRLSRVASAQPKRQRIDLAQLCQEASTNLRHREPRRSVHVRIPSDLPADADPQLARIVVENLMQNAWKFTRARPDARIEVGLTGEKEEPVFFVRDNGIGFDMTEAAQLFRPFRRLSTASGYEGSGVGLATVRRIAERHGGHVWTEASRGGGATFYVSFGRPPQEETPASAMRNLANGQLMSR
jgi:PAS domain S-box-containing protein